MGNQPDTVHIMLLGSVHVRAGAQQLPLRGRRQRISVARLALAEGRPVPVSSLIEDLWNEKRPTDAVHALQAHMHRLRALLPLEIEFINDGYRLLGGSVQVDAKQFAELYERGRSHLMAGKAKQAAGYLDGALRLWHGPALSDIDDVIGVRPYALRLSSMRRAASEDRVEALLQCGEGEALVTELRASLALDPLQETTWHQLMRALWHAGQEAEAIAAYGQAREAFIEVLGAEPGSRLAQLHDQLLNAAPASKPGQKVWSPANARQTGRQEEESVLVGRRDELAVLEQAWKRSRNGLQVVTLSGEPGIGKTCLSEALARRISKPGVVALQGRCDPSISLPYQPFSDMLREFAETAPGEPGEVAPELARILPGLAREAPDAPPADGEDVDPYRAMDALAAWFSERSQHGAILIRIDDLHWADEQTVLTLSHLLHSPRRINALIVLGVRDLHAAPPETSPFADFLRQSDRVTHLLLPRLSREETLELVSLEQERLVGADIAPVGADEYVVTASGGNPLFIVELIRQLLISSKARPGEIPATPASVSSVIQGRISELPDGTQTLLQTAAVVGPHFELAFLSKLRDASIAEVNLALVPALDARLVEASPAEPLQYFFSHDIVRTVIYESLNAADRAQYHSRVVLTLDAEDADLKKHQLLAHHYRNSDLPLGSHHAARHLLIAGQASLTRAAPSDAERLLVESINLLDEETDKELRCDALIALGLAQQRLAHPEYRNTLLEASRIAVELDDTERLTNAVLANNRGWWASTGTIDFDRIAYIETALERRGTDPPAVRTRLQIAWALENVRDPGARDAVLTTSAEALELAEQSGDGRALAWVLSHRYAVLHALFESPGEWVRLNERLLSLANRYGDPHMRLSAAVGLTQSNQRMGDFAVADRYLTEATRLAEALDDPSRLWLVRGWHAMRAIQRKQFGLAEKLIFETFELGTRTGQADALTWFVGQLFTLRMLQGRLSEVVDQARDQVATMAGGIPAWRAAMALALATTGHLDEAGRILEELAAGEFKQIPRDMLWLNGVHYLTLACEELGRDDDAAPLYRLLLPYEGMVASTGTVGAGPVDLHLGILAGMQNRTDVASGHFREAAALCRRIDAPAWLDQIEERRANIGDST